MTFWIYFFASPIVILAAILLYLLVRERSELRRFTAWAAILSGLAAPILAIWESGNRSAFQTTIAPLLSLDRKIWLVSIVAALLGLAWYLRSRRVFSFLVFATSFLVAAFWTAVAQPF